MEIKGTISAATGTKTKTGKDIYYVSLVGSETTYSGWGSLPYGINVGTNVTLTYEVNGQFNNIKTITLESTGQQTINQETIPEETIPIENVQETTKPKVPQNIWDEKDRRIAREACLKTAAEALKCMEIEQLKEISKGKGIKVLITEFAEFFEEWVYRKDGDSSERTIDY